MFKLRKDNLAFKKELEKNVDYLDLDYRGPDELGQVTIRGGGPILNQYKIWLQSGKTDYIRQPGKGGFFAYNLNNYPFSPDSEETIARDLESLTEEKFPQIILLSCKVTCLVSQRSWHVKLIVADKTTGLVGLDLRQEGVSLEYNYPKG